MRDAFANPDTPYTFYGNYPFSSSLGPIYGVLLEKYPSVKLVGFVVEDNPGGYAVQAVSQEVAKAHGLQVLEPQIHPMESPEHVPQWTKIMMQKPDAVDEGQKMPQNSANCLKQGRQMGFQGPIFSPVPGYPHLILSMVGSKEAATDFIYTSYDPYDTENTPPMVQDIVKMWESSGQKNPFDPDGIESWNTMWSLVQAIEKAQSLDATDVKNAWESMENIETATGPARRGGAKTFGINHIVCGTAPICRLQNGQVEYQVA